MHKLKIGSFVILSLFLLLSMGSVSCKASRMEKKAIREAERKQNKIDDKLVKEYDKKYKYQTKIQPEAQRKMIQQSRKKPKNMHRSERRFFLWRWLGI